MWLIFKKRKLKRISIYTKIFGVICFICVYIAIKCLDPVVKQSIHRYFVGHNIIRGLRALNTKFSRNSFCGEQLSFGEMCPKLYTELASCEPSKNGFDCPDIRHHGSTKLRQAQLALTRMLRIFDLIARKYNMPYWIRSGTLIGAIRHQGFIPWDDDIDIEIPLMYYIDFFKNFSRDLPHDMFFQTSTTDKHHHPPNNFSKNFKTTLISDYGVGIYSGGWRPKVRDRSSCYTYCLYSGCKWYDGLQIDIFVTDTIPWGIFPLREMQFEGFNVLVPNNWKSVISAEYPHFMDLPSKEDRIPKNMKLDPTRSCEEVSSTGAMWWWLFCPRTDPCAWYPTVYPHLISISTVVFYDLFSICKESIL